MQTRKRAVPDQGVVGGDLAIKGIFNHRLELQTQLGGKAITRTEQLAGDKPLKGIAAHEQCDTLALLKVQDAHARMIQIIQINLEKLITRIGFKDIDQRLAIVTCRREASTFDRFGQFHPQKRDKARAEVIGNRGKQTDKQVLPNHLALGVELFDDNRIKMH